MGEDDTSTCLLPVQAKKRRSRRLDNLQSGSILLLLSFEKVRKRFWSKVVVGGPDDCWLWQGATWETGYGKMYLPGPVPFGAHRASWIMHNGVEIPDELFVCHRCDVKPCVNPGHLFLGTPLENTRDALTKGLMPVGSRQGSSKLTESDVATIKRRLQAGASHGELAEEFEVSTAAIWLIEQGVNWKQIPFPEA